MQHILIHHLLVTVPVSTGSRVPATAQALSTGPGFPEGHKDGNQGHLDP